MKIRKNLNMFNLNFFIGVYKKDENNFSFEDGLISAPLQDFFLIEDKNFEVLQVEKGKTIGDHIIHFLSHQDKPPLNIKNKINISKFCSEVDLNYPGYDDFFTRVDDNSILYYFLNNTEHLSLFFYLFDRFFYYYNQNITLVNTKLYLQYLFRTSNLVTAYHIYIYFLFYFGRYNIIKNINDFYIQNLSQYSIYEIVLDMINNESFNYKNNIEDVLKIIGDENQLVKSVDPNDMFLWFANRLVGENQKTINTVVEFFYQTGLHINEKTFNFIINSEQIDCKFKKVVQYKEVGF